MANEPWIEANDQVLMDSIIKHEGDKDTIYGMINAGSLEAADNCDVAACMSQGLWPAYVDTEGKDTVGVGHLITGNEDYDCYGGVTDEVVMRQLANDVVVHLQAARGLAENNNMRIAGNYVVQRFMTEMCFNIGVSGYSKFRNGLMKLTSAVNGDGRFSYNDAADEHLDSKWARQVKDRAIEMVDTLRALDTQDAFTTG